MTVLAVAIAALIAGGAVAVAGLGIVLVILVTEHTKRVEAVLKTDLSVERSLRLLAETERDGLKQAVSLQAEAIEKGALPWFPKSDKLDARYEREALDKIENPYAYADIVDGLGGTR